MKLTITKAKLCAGELDKRQHIPGHVLAFKCPDCGQERSIDYGLDYLSYPKPNTFADLVLYCPACDHEWEAGQIRVNVGLTVLDARGLTLVPEIV